MSWLDQLKQASWRGVPFQVDTIEVQAGDNVVLRDYPFQDLPQVFRMGEGAEIIRMSAYVIGDDYADQRDRLRGVLTGEGVLVHPTAGAVRVYLADRYTMSEAPLREGGVVRFDLTFARAEARSYPAPTPNTQGQASDAAAAVKDSAQDQFAAEFSLSTAPAWVQARVVERIQGSVGGAWDKLKAATTGLGEFTDAAVGSYQVLRDGVVDLARTPAELAGAVRELFELPSDLSDATAATFRGAFESVFGLGSTLLDTDFEVVLPANESRPAMMGLGRAEALGVDTASRRELGRLNASVDRLFDSLAIAAWLETITAVELPGYDKAQAWRATLHTRCTQLLTQASAEQAPVSMPASSWHDDVLAMMTAGLRDLQVRGRDQARMTSYTPQRWCSIWELSYLLYGTAAWADELVAMNPHIVNPLLVQPGRALRVVAHD